MALNTRQVDSSPGPVPIDVSREGGFDGERRCQVNLESSERALDSSCRSKVLMAIRNAPEIRMVVVSGA